MKTLLLATAVAVLAPAAAQAAAIHYPPTSDAYSSTFGPYVAGGQVSGVSIRSTNGVVDPAYTYDSTGGSVKSSSHSADGYTNSTVVQGNTGNASSVTADLHNGTVKATVSNGNGPLARSFAEGTIADTLYFHNSTDGVIYLAYSFASDGTITGTDINGSRATATLYTVGGQGCDANFEGCLSGYDLAGGASVSAGLNITYWGDGSTSITNWASPDLPGSYTVQRNSVGNDFNSIVSAVLAIPVGYNTFSFRLSQSLDCSGFYTVCDFGHTSQFGFPALPDGLTYSSASGVFEIAAGPSSPGGVPEPATWALMILGFGAAGTMLRRRPLAA